VEKPDVNNSEVDEWAIKDDLTCVPALLSLKGLGLKGAEELVKNRPPEGFSSLQSFFYDGSEWRYSKFNKKCLESILRMEGLRNVPGAVGPNGMFKNHAHLERALFGETTRPSKAKKGALVTYKNLALLKDNRITFEELALNCSDADWPTVQKIEYQKEIVGFYDKSLIVGKFLKMFQEFDIDAIDEAPDDENKTRVWATVDEVQQKKARNGNPFLVVSASGVSERPYSFRVWKTAANSTPFWIVGNVLVFSLNYDKEWGYNVPPNCKIIKVEK
jgi:DNA polymerase III alpha subunit